MTWSPCLKHDWADTDKGGVHYCRKCGISGFSQIKHAPWAGGRRTPVRTYSCPSCGGATPKIGELCPCCLPQHPYNERIQDYDSKYIRYLSLPEKGKDFLKILFSLGEGYHRINEKNGFVRSAGMVRSLQTKKMIEKKREGTHNLWSLSGWVITFVKKDLSME